MRLSAEMVNAKSFDRETLIAITGNNSTANNVKEPCFSYLIRREVWTSKLCSTPHPQWKFLCPSDHIHGEPRYRSHRHKEDTIFYPVLPKSRAEFGFDDKDVKTLQSLKDED
jgi:hypothetical protein